MHSKKSEAYVTDLVNTSYKGKKSEAYVTALVNASCKSKNGSIKHNVFSRNFLSGT